MFLTNRIDGGGHTMKAAEHNIEEKEQQLVEEAAKPMRPQAARPDERATLPLLAVATAIRAPR